MSRPVLSRADAARNTALALAPAMASPQCPTWSGAEWVGLLDLEDLARDLEPAVNVQLRDLHLRNAYGYANARLLIRQHGRVRGFVTVGVRFGRVDAGEVVRAAAELPGVDDDPRCVTSPPVTVAVCTRDRADQLAVALDSVRALDYWPLEIVVVDNAPTTSATAEYLQTVADPRLRVVVEPRPGLARARNTALRHARGEIVAFTDDDVVVDPAWISRIVDGFARAPDVVCVTGLVPSGELREPVQAYFDQRVTWSHSCGPVQFRLSEPPAGVPLFPFQVGIYGTGANFALRRSAAFDLGGFDEALGVGRPTGGGEDIDLFVRVVAAGHGLAYEPSAIVWHRHRADAAALTVQAIGYGTGLGAWLTKVALDRRLALPAARLAVGAGRRVVMLGRPPAVATDERVDPALRDTLTEVGRAERRALLRGPWRYAQARRTGAARPLLADESARGKRPLQAESSAGAQGGPVARTTSSRHRTPPSRTVTAADGAAVIAALLSVAAVLIQGPGIPVAVRGLALGGFVLLAPGCAVLTRVRIPASAQIIVVPCFGVAVVVLCTWASTELIGLSPRLVLAVLAAAVLSVCARPAIAVLRSAT